MARACLDYGIKHNQEYFNERIRNASREVVMKEMENQGLLHCFLCTRRAPLRKLQSGQYVCETHFSLISKNQEALTNGQKI